MNERRHDIDWLRNLGILLLFPFHAARVFDIFEPNYVKNAVWTPGLALSNPHPGLSDALSLFLFFTGYWFMPLLFWLAGTSSWHALQKRRGGEYARERVNRLLIPLAFGLLAVVPPQAYIARLMQGWHGSYFQFLAGYFTDFSDLSGYTGTFTPAHLWFILYLFIVSMALLPLMVSVRRQAGAAAETGRATAFLQRIGSPGAFLALVVPVTLSEALPDIGGKNIFFYGGIFLIGFLYGGSERMQRTVDRLKLPALAALPACLALFWLMTFRWGFGAYPDISAPQIAMAFVRNLTLLLTLTALLGWGRRYLNRKPKALPYMNRAAFPVYILHQTVLIAVAYFAVQWALPVWAKFALIALLSFGATLGIYELLIRRIGFMRFLLGVK